MQVPYRRFSIRTSGNGGTSLAPVSSRISSQIAPECCYQQEVRWYSISLAVGRRSPSARRWPHHSRGTRGNRPDLAPLLVQSAASLQRYALVVTRLTSSDLHHSGSSSVRTVIAIWPSPSLFAGDSDSQRNTSSKLQSNALAIRCAISSEGMH